MLPGFEIFNNGKKFIIMSFVLNFNLKNTLLASKLKKLDCSKTLIFNIFYIFKHLELGQFFKFCN